MKFNSFLVQNTFTFYHSINHKWKLLKDSKQPQIITKTNEFVLGVFLGASFFFYIVFSWKIFFFNKFFQLIFFIFICIYMRDEFPKVKVLYWKHWNAITVLNKYRFINHIVLKLCICFKCVNFADKLPGDELIECKLYTF